MTPRNRFYKTLLYMRALSLQKMRSFVGHHALVGGLFMFIAALWAVAGRSFLFVSPSMQSIIFLQNIYFVFVFISVCASVGKSFQPFHFKQSAVQAWALPASPMEKYAGTALYYFLSHVVFMLALVFVVSNAMFLLSSLITLGGGMLDSDFYEDWFSDFFVYEYAGFAGNLAIAFGYFLCGAVLFRRNQFLKTVLGVGFIAGLCVFVLLLVGAAHIVNAMQSAAGGYSFVGQYNVAPFIMYVVIVGSILAIGAGYARFIRMQAAA